MAIPRSKVIADKKEGKDPMDNKEAYKQKLKARLDQIKANIDELQAKADEAEADAKLAYQRQIDELRDKQQKARESLNELAEAQGEAWKDMTSGF